MKYLSYRSSYSFLLALSLLAPTCSQADVKKVTESTEQKKLDSFRKSLAEGDDTSCGLVIEKKAKLARIQIKSSNNEQWIKLDEIFPVGQSCSSIQKETVNATSKVVQEVAKDPHACPTGEQKTKMEDLMNQVMQSTYEYGGEWDSVNHTSIIKGYKSTYWFDRAQDCSEIKLMLRSGLTGKTRPIITIYPDGTSIEGSRY